MTSAQRAMRLLTNPIESEADNAVKADYAEEYGLTLLAHFLRTRPYEGPPEPLDFGFVYYLLVEYERFDVESFEGPSELRKAICLRSYGVSPTGIPL